MERHVTSTDKIAGEIAALRNSEVIKSRSFKDYTSGLMVMPMERLRNITGSFYEVMLAKVVFVLRKRGLLDAQMVPGKEYARLSRAIGRCPVYVEPPPEPVQVTVEEEVPPVEAPF